MKSDAEEAFAEAWACAGLFAPPDREYLFHPERQWAFDFAWPEIRLAVEIEGSGHRRIPRFRQDTEKYNTAIALGWRVLRFQGCDYKPSRSRDVYPRGAADWAGITLEIMCDAH